MSGRRGGGRFIGWDFDIFQKIAVKFTTPGQKCEVKYNWISHHGKWLVVTGTNKNSNIPTPGPARCSSRKYSCPPQGRLMEIPRGRGVSKAQFFEGKYDTKMEFPEEWRVQFKKPSMGGVWIFSGTTQDNSNALIPGQSNGSKSHLMPRSPPPPTSLTLIGALT